MNAATFWARTYPIGGHLIWTGRTDRDGYGRCKVKKHWKPAYRHAWELTYGPIPNGMHVLHRCDTRPCVNPAHLFLGSNEDNLRDAREKGRIPPARTPKPPRPEQTSCPNGHTYSDGSFHRDPRGIRRCHVCRRAKEKRKAARD